MLSKMRMPVPEKGGGSPKEMKAQLHMQPDPPELDLGVEGNVYPSMIFFHLFCPFPLLKGRQSACTVQTMLPLPFPVLSMPCFKKACTPGT